MELERELELKNEIKPRSVKHIICNPKYRYVTDIFCAIFIFRNRYNYICDKQIELTCVRKVLDPYHG